MRLLKRAAVLLTAALSLVAMTIGATQAGFLAQPSYYATKSGANIEPINVIVAERTKFNGTSNTDLENTLTWSGGWFKQTNCYDPLVTFQGSGITSTWSTDNGTARDPFPFIGCGNGERNHFRAFGYIDQWIGDWFRDTLYVAASLETVAGTNRYDGANNLQGVCGQFAGSEGAVHCLTRNAFDWGRDGYAPVPNDKGVWPAILSSWSHANGYALYGYMTTLNPAPTAWIWQAGAWFRGDGRAGIVEDGLNLAQGRPATASSQLNASYPPAYAVDDPGNNNDFNNNSRWVSSATMPAGGHWLKVDLGSPPVYDTVQVTSGWWNGSALTNPLRDFRIQVSSDNVNWTTVGTATGMTGAVITMGIGTRQSRWIRLVATAINGDTTARVFTFKVMQRP